MAVGGSMFCWRYWPFQRSVTLAVLTGPPVAVRSSSPTVPRAVRAAATSAAVAFHAIGAVVSPPKVSVKVPPVLPLTRIVWVSVVFMSLCGEKPPEFPPPAGVSSPVTNQRLLSLSKSMSPPTWQQAPRLLGTWRIFCSESRSSEGVGPSTNLNRESWK